MACAYEAEHCSELALRFLFFKRDDRTLIEYVRVRIAVAVIVAPEDRSLRLPQLQHFACTSGRR